MQYFSDEQLDDMFGLLDLGQLEMMGYDNVRQVSNSDELEDLLMTIEEDFSNMDRDEKISELRSVGAFDDDYLVDEVKMGAETKRQRVKREKDEAAMDDASTDVEYMREHYAENQDMMCCGEQMEFYDDNEPYYFYCPVCEESIETKEFQAPYVGSGALMDIHKDTGLDAFTPGELTHSSAIHGDFDQASLNYSGHQNIEVRRAEGDLKKMFDQMLPPSHIKCDLCSWQGDNFNYHIAYDCPGTISHRAMLVNAYEKDFSAETFEAASTAPPNLAREKSNLRDAIRAEVDSNFEYKQVVWGPYWVRFEAANSNKWYGILVYNNGKGVFRALGGFGGMGNSPNLVDLATTRSQAQAESAAKRRLKAKERKGYFAYSAESFDAKKPHLPPEAVQKDYENMQKDLNRFVNTLCECKQSKGAPSAVNINTSCGYCGEEIDEVSFYGLTKEAESFDAEFEQLSDAAVAVSDRYDVNVGYIVATDADDDEGDDDVTISITDDEMEPIAEVDLGQSWSDYNPEDEDYYHSEQYYAADSPFNTMLLIRHDVVIEEETDFNHLLQIYLELEQDIAYLYSTDGEKHHLLPEMMRYRNQIASRLDEIQEEIEIQDTIEMDAEGATHITLDQPMVTGFKMGAGWIAALATIPLVILGLGALYNKE